MTSTEANNGGKPMIESGITTRTFLGPEGNITLILDKPMGLFTVTDCNRIGHHIVQVNYSGGSFDTKYLLGHLEDEMCPIARHLAPTIMGISEDGPDADTPAIPGTDQQLLMTISLKKPTPEVVKAIKAELKNPFTPMSMMNLT